MAENILTMENIVKTYKMGDEQQTVLKGIDLQVDKGEFVAILGPSGSGKSTLMNIIGCLDTATSGTYHLHGRDVSALSESELARVRSKEIGFIFQSFQLLQRQDALQNVELPLIYAGMSGHERAARAQQMLERVGLKDKMHHFPNQLSGGQQQRVAIARALANNPTILLADEPTGFIFQSFQLLQRQDALQNVELPLIYAGMSGHERAARAQQMLERVGLKDKMHHFPNQLSGGQQQRVAIARALANNPTILLADEPTGALDRATGRQVMSLFHDLNDEGRTIIMITHDIEIARHARRIVRILDGEISEGVVEDA